MRRIEEFQADNFLKKRKVHKYIRRAVALLSAFVMLFTVNTLKRNANTLERIPTCGYEEHVHDGSCFNEAGELICGMEEHIHTDACYQAAPADSSEEIEVELGEDDEGEPPTEEEVIPVEAEAPAQNDDAAYALATPALVSGIVAAKRPDVDMKHVVEVGAIEDDAAHAGLLGVEFVEGGDWLISAQKPFNDAELALILDDGSIEIVELKDGVPADAEEPETDEEQTEVESEQTEDGLETEEPTEVDIEAEDTEAVETDTELPAEEDTSIETQETADAPEADDGETTLTETENEDTQPAADEQGETQDEQPADDEQAEAKDEQTADAEPQTEGQQPEAQDEQAETQDEQPEDAEATDEETAEDNGDEETELADETEGDETDETNEETEDQAPAEEAPSVSVTVDLSSVDLMDAASVEADTVKLSVADLLNAEDDAVQLDGELAVDSAAFADAATVVAADNVAVEDGVITLTAEAMEAGSVTLEMTTEAEPENEGDEPVVTTQTVQIDLTGYTGRVTEEIKSDPEVQIVPAEGNSLPADAYAAVTTGGDVPEELLDAEAAESETTVQSAAAFDITITNDNNDEISKTGEVEVTLMPGDLNALADVPEDATVENLEYELYHVHDDGTIEKVEDAVFDVAEDGTVNSVTFTTDSFSTYVVKYTVDFTYVDASGEKHFWQFPGVGSHALREVLSALGIEGETIADPELELTEAVDEVGENDLYLTQNLETAEWFINSDAPFDDTYTLTVTVDEVLYTIIVTDDQQAEEPYNPEWTVNVKLFERNGSEADTNDLTALRRTTYGVMTVIYDKYEGTPLGYKIMGSQFRYGGNVDNPDGCKNTMSLKFNLNECRKLTQSGGAWVDDGAGFNFNTDENAWVVDADHKYAPKDVDIQFELFEAEDYGGAPDYNRVSVDGWNSKSYQTAYQYARGVTGFDFKPWPNGHKVNASSHTAELNLQRAYTKTYKLRVNTAPTNVGIPHDDYLYALVRLNAGLATEKTGMFHIHFPASSKEETYEFGASEWKKTSIGSSGTNSISNLTFTGDETVEVFLFYKHNGQGNVSAGFDDIYSHCIPEITAKSEYSEYKDGDTAYGMEVSLTPIRSVVNNDAAGETYIYDTINFLTLDPTGSITKSHIDSVLQDARDFGYYTLKYIGHSGDIEATIGADYMNANFLADYGYSQRNVQTNVLKVKKVYLKDGKPNPHQSVTIKLYKTDKDGNKTGEAIETKTGETNDKGILELEFTGLEPGGYTVSERLGSGPEIFPGSSGQVSGLTTTFSAADVRFVENGNVNYFGTIGYPNNDAGNERLDRMLSKGKRVPLVILTNSQETVTRIENWVSNHSDAYGSGKVSAYINGAPGYKTYDIPSDMERLRTLSNVLATSTDSHTVRVVNIKASELTEEGLSFSNENRFIVINVLMDQDTFCPMVRLNGRILEGDFGRGGKENSTKVLFNLRSADGMQGYGQGTDDSGQAEFNTSKTGAGVILAPWANAHELGGVFGGTIISRWVDRKGNEIHSDNPNQRQNLNITIQNEEGTPKVGMLELRKAYSDPSIKDKITYFPFKVKLTSDPMGKVANQRFPASGLKDDKDEVEFDANGEAIVWVRADNSVTIANLPAGTTYEVTEDLTGTDLEDLYTFVEAKNGKNSGTIVVSKTDSVTLINDVPRSGIKLKKVVEGTDATDKEFHFELYLWHKDGDSAATAFTNAELTNVTAKKNNETIALFSFSDKNYGGHAAGVYAFTLNNGDEIVIEGLPNGLHFAFVETGTDSLPDGYQVVTEYGKVEGTLPVSEAKIINKYEAEGNITLHAKKDANIELGDKEFTFVLTDESGENELDRRTIKQGETADFNALTFVRNKDASADTTFAITESPAEYTFYIKEVIPDEAVAETDGSLTYAAAVAAGQDVTEIVWVYDDVKYDSHVCEVTVTVTDDGAGNLTAVSNLEDDTETFINTPVEKAKVQVKKVWSGSPDKDATLYLLRFKKDYTPLSTPGISKNVTVNLTIDNSNGDLPEGWYLWSFLTRAEGGDNIDLETLWPGKESHTNQSVDWNGGRTFVCGINYNAEVIASNRIPLQTTVSGPTAVSDSEVRYNVTVSRQAKTREVNVSVSWTGTPASGATVTATASAEGETKTATLSADSWSGTFAGLTVGKTYNVTFAVTGDANASVAAVNGFVVSADNRVEGEGTVNVTTPTDTTSVAWTVINYDNNQITYDVLCGSGKFQVGATVHGEMILKNGYYRNRPFEVYYNNIQLSSEPEPVTINGEYVNKHEFNFEVVKGAELLIKVGMNSISEDIYSGVSLSEASAFASPFQLAWSPFTAYADEATLAALPEGIADGVTGLPSGYVLDDAWPVPLKVSEGLKKTIDDLDIKDPSGNVYYYAIVEADMADYIVTYSRGGDHPQAVSAADLTGTETAVLQATNTYKYITATPNVVKLIDGKAFNGKLNGENISFKFTIRQIDPEGQTYEKTVTSASDGSVTFPAIVYTTAGIYRYEIRETVVANDTRVSYVSTPLYWLVNVEEKDGKLVKTKDNYHSTSNCIDHPGAEQAAFNNHELTYVDIVKQWCLNAGDASDGYPFSGGAPTVKVYLHRKTVGSDDDKIIDADPDEDGDQPFTVPYDAEKKKWYLHIPGLEKYDKNGNEYQYYIVEDSSNMQGWTPYLYKADGGEGKQVPSAATVTGEGTLTVVNSASTVALPATGGAGTNAIYAAGAGLVLLALGWWLARMKKRDNDA